MSWQDLVLAAGGFVISAGIVPTILSAVKPPLATTTILVSVLAVSTVAFATLGLWLTAAGCAIQVGLWGIVLAQSVIARRAANASPVSPTTTLTEVVVTTPPLGFEEFEPDPLPEAATA
jgi:hypothetical protein